jgi:acetyltransferase-like isoleucine patch superfamily enzyme
MTSEPPATKRPVGPSPLGKRNYEEHVTGGPNAHQRWYAVRNGINGPLLAMILTHEFLQDRCRRGRVVIGSGGVVGANSTVLAGVEIGDKARISAMSLVHKSVPAGMFVGGVPIEPRSS